MFRFDAVLVAVHGICNANSKNRVACEGFPSEIVTIAIPETAESHCDALPSLFT